MRKSQKNQIEKIIELLGKAHSAVKGELEQKNYEVVLNLLEECQNSAIQVGNLIEDTEGADFATIEILESYCEQVYQAYEDVRKQQPVNSGKIYKSLRKGLIRIENSVKNDIKIRTTAVFLPYKASMWDSLESVWKAAVSDQNCDAYVVPIPYYDKDPAGNFKEMHYEGNEYPDYVDVTPWEEYDIEAEHPDVIFIHNPYDEFNNVTSVPPAYYAKELKKFTDSLVYIPYFILGEVDPENTKKVESIEHFCAVPAVVYADKVIVQSEKMRKIYIDVMTKTMGRDTRPIWEEKIRGTGSPKIDKVLSTHKDDVNVPERWTDIIEKADGTRKKIVFYNTSVSALLKHDENMMQKLEQVLNFFKENQNEITLLWRPHPLIKATIESMRPQLWIEYEKIVREYKEENWGIYDDSADLNRAIVVSDAYYGDPSSVVELYKKTGKPVVKQKVEELEKESSVYFYKSVLIKNKLWFISTVHKFMNIDIETGRCSYVFWEERNKWENQSALDELYIYDESIFWIDYKVNRLHEYNFKSNVYCNYVMPGMEEINVRNVLHIFLHNTMLCIFMREAPYLATIDLAQKQCVKRSELFQEWNCEEGNDLGLLCRGEEDHWVYWFWKDRKAVKMDLNAWEYEYIVMPDEIPNITYAVWRNNSFYLLSSMKCLYQWDGKSKRTEIIYQCMEEEVTFGAIAVTDNRVFLLPAYSEKIMIVNMSDKTVTEYNDYPNDFQYIARKEEKYGKYNEDDQHIWYPNRASNYILCIDKQNECIKWVKILKPSIYEESFFKKKTEGEGLCMVETSESLDRFMDMTDYKPDSDEEGKEQDNIGKLIWDMES